MKMAIAVSKYEYGWIVRLHRSVSGKAIWGRCLGYLGPIYDRRASAMRAGRDLASFLRIGWLGEAEVRTGQAI